MATDDDAELAAITARYAPKPTIGSGDPELDAIAARYAPKPKKELPAWIKRTLAEPDPDAPTVTAGSMQINPEGRWNFKDRKWEAAKPVKAAFTDQGTMTAGQLNRIEEDQLSRGRAALAGGMIRGAGYDLADEGAGAIAAGKAVLKGESPVKAYRDTRDEARRALKESEGWDPNAALKGQLIGTAASAATGVGAPKGAQLLTLANTGRAAGMGGLVSLGASEADLTKGEVGQAAWDTAKGAGVGAGVNTGLGVLGAGVSKIKDFVRNAPESVAEKADNALIDNATLGAPAGQRDALMGDLGLDRPRVLDLIKSNPELQKAIREGRKADAALILKGMQGAHATEAAAAMAGIDKDRQIDVTPFLSKMEDRAKALEASPSAENQVEAASLRKRIDLIKERWMPEEPLAFNTTRGKVKAGPIVDALEAQRVALAANPSAEAQAEAAKLQKRIDLVKEKWIPEPKKPEPKGNELLGKLVEGADAGDKQRAGVNAKEFLKVARDHELGKVVNDPEKTLAATDKALTAMGKERAKLYGQLGEAAEVPIGNVTAKLSDWRDELAKSASGLEDVPKVDALIERVWKAHGRDGRATMPAEELRGEISNIQKRAFSGSYLDPNKSAEMGREAAGRMRQALDEHIAKVDATLPPDSEVGRKIADLNRRYAPMIMFRDAAEKRAAAARLLPPTPPETRTGFAPVSDAIALANTTEDPAVKKLIADELAKQLGAPAVNPNRGKALPSAVRDLAATTKDAEVKRAITGELYNQTGTDAAHRMAALDDRAELMSRLEEPLAHVSRREASPPTTLRSHARSIGEQIKSTGTAGAMAVGAATAASGAPQVGVPIMLGAVAAKYGRAVADKAERAAVTMEYAIRRGAQRKDLATIGKLAGLPPSVAADLVESVAPQATARATAKGKDE